jgi:hypothetical protein
MRDEGPKGYASLNEGGGMKALKDTFHLMRDGGPNE